MGRPLSVANKVVCFDRVVLQWLTAVGAAAAAVLLTGCSALQIDVDVYKGPLISQEEVQREQLVAMAMSAKTLLYTMRNQFLDDSCPGWSSQTHNRRDKVITEDLWATSIPDPDKPQQVLPKLCLVTVNPSSHFTSAHRFSDFTRARRLNDVLTAYNDHGACAEAPKRARLADDENHENAFANGRIECGIDSLANDYSAKRDKQQTENLNISASKRAFSRLTHAMVDLGGRLQFLATNQWLIDGEDPLNVIGWLNPLSEAPLSSVDKNKALLESIANNIIVHADDLRRQEEHEGTLAQGAAAESRGAERGFAQDPADSYRNIEQALTEGRSAALRQEEAASAAVGNGAVSKARATVQTAKEARDKESDMYAAARAAEDRMAWLQLTIGAGSPAAGVPAVRFSPPETSANWQSDQEALKKALKLSEVDKLDVEQLRADLAQWLQDESAPYTAQAARNLPRSRRLSAAVAAVDALVPSVVPKPNPMSRQSAWAEWKRRVREAASGAASSREECGKRLKAAEEELAKAERNLATALAQARAALALTVRRPSADYAAAKTVVDELRDRVITELRRGSATPNMATVSEKLRAEVASAAASAASGASDKAKVDQLKKAGEVLAELVTEPTLAAGPPGQTSKQVLEGVLAQLRYRYLQLLGSRGADDPETQSTQSELRAAEEQHNDMVYLRPASSYLRSVYAATVTQDTSISSQWQNMLLENTAFVHFGRQIGNTLGWQFDIARARDELEKAYWQNINSVKVAAAGHSNFVIAKDDVGNWYVKAMGSDSSAMVKAARNLALYNAGAGLNTDLLRVNDLRSRIDTENDSGKRKEMRTELDSLAGSASGPTVSERSRTLTLFRKNYQDLSETQRDALAKRLALQEFRDAIKQRWATTLAAADADVRETLQKAFDKPELAATYRAATDALAPDPAGGGTDKATLKPVGDKLLAALRALQSWRAQIKAEVLGAEGLTSDQVTAVKSAAAALETAQRDQADAVSRRDKATQAVADADKDFKSKDNLAPATRVAEIDAAWNNARASFNEAVAKAAEADRKLSIGRSALDDKQKLLDAAKARQQAAQADVDTVVKSAIDEIVKQRLQVVRDTETAVKIVGGSGP